MKLGGGKEWFTAAELAELKLPGLPSTKRKINERATAEMWALRTGAGGAPLARPRQARGGGLEYHVELLPAATRAAIAAMGVATSADIHASIADVAPATGPAQLWRWFDSATDRVKTEAYRRLGAVQLVCGYERAGLTRSAAVSAAAGQAGVGASTLWTWLELITGVADADRLVYLAPRRQGGGAEAAIDQGAWQFLISDYLRLERPTFSICYWRMKREYADPRGLIIPHERTLRRKFEREIDGRLVIGRREGAEALRRTLPSQQRSVADLHALEVLNIDGHKFDVFVKWEDGRIGRPLMVALQDIFSRKLVAHRIDESENALATRLVFADCFRDWGIPRACVLDNGRAFASKAITGGAKTRFRFKIKDTDPTGVLTALGIEVKWATPYRGQSKPIERAFKDLCDSIARHPAFAGAYTGNRPDAKPENYGSRAIPIADFRRIGAAGIAAHNARPGRRTETAQGRSFDETFAASYAAAPIGKATPEQLRLALLTAEERRSDRQTGELRFEGNRYYAGELAAHAGKQLTIRFDPDNLHTSIFVYDRAGAFICEAEIIAATGFLDRASANKRRAQESNLKRLVREKEEAAQLLDAAEIAAMIPDYADEAPPLVPSVVRPVRHRGQTAAALKVERPAPHPEPAGRAVIDRFASAAAHLRIVE